MVGPADQLRPMAQRSNAPRVVVVGYLEHSLLRAFMKAAYALVFPSIYEGFGLPPLEAMALGVPVVAVKAGAIPEVVADAGVLADDGSVESLRAAVRALLEQPALVEQLKTAGPRRAAGFSWQRHAELMLALYARAAET
jgi:alpha-1,3-rhamnosyl/mannosyltransferase